MVRETAGKGRRIAAALAVAALCAPGTFLRTEVPTSFPTDIALSQVAGPSETGTPGWRVEGVWRYSTGPTRMFGGYSALFAIGPDRLRAFSDRGTRFTFTPPDRLRSGEGGDYRDVSRQLVDPRFANDLWDIESATRDPATGNYWLGFEGTHAIHRYSIASDFEDVRLLQGEVDWYVNSGAEAMVRLADGRFVVLAEGEEEGRSEGLIYSGDPVVGDTPTRFEVQLPVSDFAITDAAQLPDGRVLLLLRSLAWDLPPFASMIAIADTPKGNETWEPAIALDLSGVLPPENYEGLAIFEESDGTLSIWVISDDNLSANQRTLVARLTFDPTAE